MKAPILSAVLGWLLTASATGAYPTSASAPWVATVAGRDLPTAALLSIGLVPLDPGIKPSATEEVRELRNAEARYFPYLLRTLLEQSESWGPVRMLPAPDPFAELSISGEIIDASAERLSVRLSVSDSTGRQWLQRQYTATAAADDYRKPGSADPFEPLFERVTADLARFRATLPLTELERIIETARLRSAAHLAPDVFGEYLLHQPDGRLKINRLPAADDPMLARVDRVRDTQYLFVDAVDRHFGRYFSELAPTYSAWREANLEASALMESYRRQSASGRSGRGEGSAFRRYRELQELKLYQQTLRETLASFAMEVGPTTLDLDGELVELSGTLEDQQRQWQNLLSRLYAAQVGLPSAPDAGEPSGDQP